MLRPPLNFNRKSSGLITRELSDRVTGSIETQLLYSSNLMPNSVTSQINVGLDVFG
jgi:hypothetical protein